MASEDSSERPLETFIHKIDELNQLVRCIPDFQKGTAIIHWTKCCRLISDALTVGKTGDIENIPCKQENELQNQPSNVRSESRNDEETSRSVEVQKTLEDSTALGSGPNFTMSDERDDVISANNTDEIVFKDLKEQSDPIQAPVSDTNMGDTGIDNDDECDDDTDHALIEEEIEFAKPKSNLPQTIEDVGTPDTNDDNSDIGSLLSFLPELSPLVKVDGKDCMVTDKEGYLHIQIEKTDGSIQSLMLASRNEGETNENIHRDTEDAGGRGKQLHLIKQQLEKLGAENEPFSIQQQENVDNSIRKNAVQGNSSRSKRGRKRLKGSNDFLENEVVGADGQKAFRCLECKTEVKSRAALQVHMMMHTGEKPFSCDICGKCFRTKGNMLKHKRSHEDIRPFECEVCQSSFKEKKTLTIHMRTHTGEKPYKCHLCEKAFSQGVVLQAHLRTHTGEKSHLCDTCGKAFRQKTQLKVHQKRHENVRDYKCDHCDFSSVSKGDLSRHVTRHSGWKPFLCSLCPKTFTRSQYLKEHMNVHLDQMPHSCKVCGMSFHDTSSLHRHKRKHKEEDQADKNSEETKNQATSLGDGSLSTDLQLVISDSASEQDVQKLQTIIVSARNRDDLELEQSSETYLENGASEETEVYRIHCVNTADLSSGEPVVVDFSAMNLLATATAKQFTIQ